MMALLHQSGGVPLLLQAMRMAADLGETAEDLARVCATAIASVAHMTGAKDTERRGRLVGTLRWGFRSPQRAPARYYAPKSGREVCQRGAETPTTHSAIMTMDVAPSRSTHWRRGVPRGFRGPRPAPERGSRRNCSGLGCTRRGFRKACRTTTAREVLARIGAVLPGGSADERTPRPADRRPEHQGTADDARHIVQPAGSTQQTPSAVSGRCAAIWHYAAGLPQVFGDTPLRRLVPTYQVGAVAVVRSARERVHTCARVDLCACPFAPFGVAPASPCAAWRGRRKWSGPPPCAEGRRARTCAVRWMYRSVTDLKRSSGL